VTTLSRLASRIGRRGAALLFFTILDTIWCIGLITVPRPLVPYYAWMAEIMPLGVWAACWGAVAAVCLWYAFRTYDTPAFMAAVGLKVGWGLFAGYGWIVGQVDRGYLSAVIWLLFAAFVFLIAGGIPAAPPRPEGRRWIWTRS
jgi:hypothetical protein